MTVIWHGSDIEKNLSSSIDEAMLICAADLQHRSVNRAPIDTGKLRESCVVDDSEIGQQIIKVGYTSEVDDYSVVQHERLDFNHPRGGEAKYLENPFNENVQQYIDRISEAVKGALR